MEESIKPFRVHLVGVLVLALTFAIGCGKETGVPNEDSADAAEPQPLPFSQASVTNGISPSHTFVPAVSKLPAGSPLTVRMQTSLSSVSSNAGDHFTAALDEPVVIEGQV